MTKKRPSQDGEPMEADDQENQEEDEEERCKRLLRRKGFTITREELENELEDLQKDTICEELIEKFIENKKKRRKIKNNQKLHEAVEKDLEAKHKNSLEELTREMDLLEKNWKEKAKELDKKTKQLKDALNINQAEQKSLFDAWVDQTCWENIPHVDQEKIKDGSTIDIFKYVVKELEQRMKKEEEEEDDDL